MFLSKLSFISLLVVNMAIGMQVCITFVLAAIVLQSVQTANGA